MYNYHSHSNHQLSSSAMSHISGIHGHLLEVTVVGCMKLKDTEWISRQDPYVIVEYSSNKSRTRTCTDGGRNPTFQEKFTFTLIEGLRELNIQVWNSNTLSYDDFIGGGKVQLQKVLTEGYDDSSWPLQTKTGRHAGEVRLILHYANAKKPTATFAPSAPPYAAPPHVSMYSPPPPAAPQGHYPPPTTAYTSSSAYPPPPAYPSQPYPPPPAYPAQPYPSPHAYPSQPYPAPSAYPPTSAYPPPPNSSPYPPPNSSPYPPPGPFPGLYPPPPY